VGILAMDVINCGYQNLGVDLVGEAGHCCITAGSDLTNSGATESILSTH